MKKLFLIAVGLLLVVGVNAQVRWGVKAGGNLSKITDKYDGKTFEGSKAQIGFHLGGMMEYSFTPEFSLQPELLFSLNSYKYDWNNDKVNWPILGEMTMNGTMSTKIYQIQVPVNLKYKMGTDNLKFFVTAGPYFGYGISGKGDVNATAKIGDISEPIIQDGVNIYENDGMKRFDFGIGAGIGLEFSKNFMVGAGYQYGIANLTDTNDSTSRIGTFQLSFGYFF